MEALNEKISMGRERRVPVQVNLLPSVINTIDQIKRETGMPKARIIEYFVRLGMNAAGYGPKGGPKGHRATEQFGYGIIPAKKDAKAYLEEIPQKKPEIQESLDTLNTRGKSKETITLEAIANLLREAAHVIQATDRNTTESSQVTKTASN